MPVQLPWQEYDCKLDIVLGSPGVKITVLKAKDLVSKAKAEDLCPRPRTWLQGQGQRLDLQGQGRS